LFLNGVGALEKLEGFLLQCLAAIHGMPVLRGIQKADRCFVSLRRRHAKMVREWMRWYGKRVECRWGRREAKKTGT
jgi:uncharacterized heparinase superfamily protein